ncbi:MAG: transglycosylase domain-containing protein [Chthoniobacterales bacterium]|nr:transglycosylase domain-containing protein [Chthoniobacterales bacterium]
MNSYHRWEKQKKSWYQRSWFLFFVSLVLLGIIALLVAYGYLSYQFADKVNAFDLSKLEKMESASGIYDRNGILIGKIFIQNRLPISSSEIPAKMVKAIVAEEDNRFFEHNGVDYFGVLRAAISNYRQGRIKQGASTVTQQLARNSFELRERSLQRKILEMFLAQRIEQTFSKEKIMELYLNRVYFGSGFYGVEAAALGYFGKHTKDLSISQSALLAGLLKSPNALSPWNNPKGAKNVRDFVLTRMHELGFISKGELQEASAEPLGAQKRTNPFKVSYAIDYVRQQAIAILGFERAMNGGARIDTTFDSKLQQVAESNLQQELTSIEQTKGYNHETYAAYHQRNSALEEKVARGGFVNFPAPAYLQGAVLAIDNATGGILALVGGRDFMHSEYDRALQGRHPPGTLFTPFVAAAAYSKGIFPGEVVEDACIDNHYVMIGGETGILGEWGVERADNDYEGMMTSHEAVARGKNAAVVRLGFMTGTGPLKQLCERAGIRSPLREVANAYLGSSEMELDELTLAFSIFPNGGSRPASLYAITKITAGDGEILFQATPKKVEVLSPEVAFQTHTILDDALHKTDAYLTSFSVGGKSGTAYDFTDLWFVGYSSSMTCGVWVGYDKPQSIFPGAFGKNLALPIWSAVMNASLTGFPPRPITPPSTLTPVEVCRRSGLLITAQCKEKEPNSAITEYATQEELPHEECPIHSNKFSNRSKDPEETEWPRAVAAVDLKSITPIPVTAPTLLASTDVYQSVLFPVAPMAKEKNKLEFTLSSSGPSNNAVPAVTPEPEVRRAEPVSPLDMPSGAAPVMELPMPKPVDF